MPYIELPFKYQTSIPYQDTVIVAGKGWRIGSYFYAVPASGVSSDYILPIQPILAVGARITGSGTLAFTMDSEAKIMAGTASFANWDGVAEINLAVTGFHFTYLTGTDSATVTVKTFYAS